MKLHRLPAVILTLVLIALASLAVVALRPVDGMTRFHNFIQKNGCFSVQIEATSSKIRSSGTGTFVVKRPDCFRSSMDWGDFDYNYVKGPDGAVEYENAGRTYQQYPPEPGLGIEESVNSDYQLDSLPMPLLRGDIKKLSPSPFKLTGSKGGVDSYGSAWDTPMGKGAVNLSIDSEGHLLSVDLTESSGLKSIHRVMHFSHYVLNPTLTAATFSIVPPLGYSSYKLPYPYPAIQIGDKLSLGTWKSAQGPVKIDSQAAGNLLIVRVPDSAPADGLIAYLAKHPLPVKSIVLSLGTSGGQFNSPPPAVGQELSLVGTPLMILLGPDESIKGLWMGFDPANPLDLPAAVSEALKGKAP